MNYRADITLKAPQYIVLPSEVLNRGLSPIQLTTLLQLLYMEQQGMPSPNSHTLAEVTGIDRPEIISAVTHLSNLSLLNANSSTVHLLGSSSSCSCGKGSSCSCSNGSSNPTAAVAVTAPPTPSKNTPPIYISPPKKVSSPPRKQFARPELQEVEEYMLHLRLPKAEAGKFMDHFESVGWKIGIGKSMKCWKAACRNWQRNFTGAGHRLLSENEQKVAVANETNPSGGPDGWKEALKEYFGIEYPEPDEAQQEKIAGWTRMKFKELPDWVQSSTVQHLRA